MREAKIRQIASWILDELAKENKQQDLDLHWKCCNTFLSRDEIMQNGRALEKLSNWFDDALMSLQKEHYVYFRDGEVWVASERDNNLERVVFGSARTSKIKCFYIIEFDNGCKVGIDTTFKQRLGSYRSPWCRPIKGIEILQNADPEEVEEHIKSCFKDTLVGRSTEFFGVSKAKIKKEVLAKFHGSVFDIYYT